MICVIFTGSEGLRIIGEVQVKLLPLPSSSIAHIQSKAQPFDAATTPVYRYLTLFAIQLLIYGFNQDFDS
jgi:hypothetical protein